MLDTHAPQAHTAGTMKKDGVQYTIRNIPQRLDMQLRETAAEYGTSLNTAALSALSRGLGVETGPVVHHDMDDLIGTWVQDDAFDRALEEMDRVDAELWQ